MQQKMFEGSGPGMDTPFSNGFVWENWLPKTVSAANTPLKSCKPESLGQVSAAVLSLLIVSVTLWDCLTHCILLPGLILQYICSAKQVIAQGRKILKAAVISPSPPPPPNWLQETALVFFWYQKPQNKALACLSLWVQKASLAQKVWG